jgi:hypothetical protein
MPRDDKVAILKESLAAIGRRIEIVLDTKQAAGEDRDRWRRHLWTCVGNPDPVSAPFLILYFVADLSRYFGPRRSRLRNSKRFMRRW